jgi:hypothetical protein
MDGLSRFRELVAEFSRLEVEERDLTDQARTTTKKIDTTPEPLRERLAKRVGERLAVVQKRQTAIIAEVEELQVADATIPNDVDDIDAGLASMRTRLHMTREARKHLQSLPFSPLARAARSQRIRELGSEEGALVRKIRAREQSVLASVSQTGVRG